MTQPSSNRQRLECKIAFLQKQLDSLDHYLPETYQYLMNEMDTQQRSLMELKIQSYYQQQCNEQQDQNPDKGYSKQDPKPDHQREGVSQ
jgi:uncharacterized coiled-coil protein SlyX